MRQVSAKAWVTGTVVLAVLLLAAAWLLAVQPVTARAAEDTAQAEQQRQQNDLLELEIVKLREQATHLDEYQAELGTLREQMPTTGDGASISRELQSIATAAGVTIVTVQPSIPEPFVGAAPVPAAAPADATAADGVAAADGATVDGATADGTQAAAPSGVSGFYTVPISMTTVGSYDAAVAFLRAVQSEASRLYLVSSITATTQEDQGASGGRPATAAGDLELTITGYAYVLIDSAALPVDPTADDDTTLPTPSGQPNPFVPAR